MIKTIVNWLGIALLLYIVWFFMKDTVVVHLIKWKLQHEGLTMQKNEWREFDLDNVVGETPANLFGGSKIGQAILKYRFELMYPFDGKVGFYGGSDRKAMRDKCRDYGGLECRIKNETAYLFRTIDDGESFTRQSLGHGVVNGIKKMGIRYFLNVHEADTYKDHTFVSDDSGEHWSKLGDFRIEALFDTDRFIYSKTKSLSISERETTYYYTKDKGKTAEPLNDKLLNYFNQSLSYNKFHVYQGHLVFLINDTLISVDIDTLEEKKIPLKKPPHQVFEVMDVDPESGELHIYTKDTDFKKKEHVDFPQLSIWFPFTDEFVRFDKDIPNVIHFNVRKNYIGGLFRYKGYLTHLWTTDKGKEWKFEMLPDYFWNTSFTGYGNGRIYMTGLVVSKRGVGDGSYLIMGKIKHK